MFPHCKMPPSAKGHVGPLFGSIHHLNRQLMDSCLAQFDLAPMQARTLGYIIRASAEREVNQRDVEQEMMIRPSTVNGIVARLEEKGLITRTAGKTDARCRVLAPTEEGLALEQRFRDSIAYSESVMLRGFSSDEKTQLCEYLQRIGANLKNEEQKHA